MDHLFCLDNRVIGGAPDRIADLASLGQFVDQQLFLGHVDSSEAKIMRHDILGVAEHVGAFDHLALPGCASQVLPVDRLADLAIAMLRAANVGDLQPIGDLGVFQCVVKIAGRDDVWCCTVVIVGNSIRLASGVELGDALG